MPIQTLVERYTGPIGAANTATTVSSKAVQSYERRKLSAVYVVYSANVSVSATITINSGLGSDWDILVNTLAFSAERYGVYIPERALPVAVGDVIDILLPAGGSGITAVATVLFDVEVDVDEERGYQAEPRMGAY